MVGEVSVNSETTITLARPATLAVLASGCIESLGSHAAHNGRTPTSYIINVHPKRLIVALNNEDHHRRTAKTEKITPTSWG